jgi:hypothetical protein
MRDSDDIRPRRSRACTTAASSTLAVAALFIASCSTQTTASNLLDPGPRLERVVHGDLDGPLSAGSGIGGNSIEAPGPVPWNATFSSFVLCSTLPEVTIALQRIRVREPVEALDTTFYLRSVSLADVDKTPPKDRSNLQTFYTALGRPPNFSDAYSTIDAPPGEYSTGIMGTSISDTCDAVEDFSLDVSLDRPPKSGFTELEVAMKVGAAGGKISKLFIDYLADGQPYTLRVDWAMIACGSQVSKSMC